MRLGQLGSGLLHNAKVSNELKVLACLVSDGEKGLTRADVPRYLQWSFHAHLNSLRKKGCEFESRPALDQHPKMKRYFLKSVPAPLLARLETELDGRVG